MQKKPTGQLNQETEKLLGITVLAKLNKLDLIVIGYARVSSLDNRQQLGLAVKTDVLKNCDLIFSEKHLGDNDNRPELAKAIELAKQLSSSGKSVTLQIYKLDRLTRKMLTLANIIDELNQHNIKLIHSNKTLKQTH